MKTNPIAATTTNVTIVQPVSVVLSIDKVENAIDVFLSFQDVNHNTPATYRRALRQFFGWVKSTGRVLNALSRADILQFKQDLRAREYSPNTINSYLCAVRRFYEFCDANEIAPNIAKHIRSEKTGNSDKHEKKAFTKEQAAAIVAQTHVEKIERKKRDPRFVKIRKTEQEYDANETTRRRDTAIIELMMRCALRTIEVSRANIGDIELLGDTYILNAWGKGDKRRPVPLTPKTWSAINEYLVNDRRGARANDPLFASNDHRPEYNGRRLSTATISRMAKRNFRAVGINDAKHTAHSCRHTALSLIIEESNDPNKLEAAQQLAGHTTTNTTMIYVKDSERKRFLQNAPNLLLDEQF